MLQVFYLFLADTVNTIFETVMLYQYLVLNFGSSQYDTLFSPLC
jgi:hypothetical protein